MVNLSNRNRRNTGTRSDLLRNSNIYSTYSSLWESALVAFLLTRLVMAGFNDRNLVGANLLLNAEIVQVSRKGPQRFYATARREVHAKHAKKGANYAKRTVKQAKGAKGVMWAFSWRVVRVSRKGRKYAKNTLKRAENTRAQFFV